jgi:Undecaprenyl-phosphate glucose phosphotransferase
MIRHRGQILVACFLTADLTLTAVAWVGAYYLRFASGCIPVYDPPPEVALCWRNLPLVLLLALFAYHFTGQYTIHRLRRVREDLVGVVKGTTLLVLLVLGTIYFLQDHYDSRGTMVLFWLLAAGLGILGRRLGWAVIRYLRGQGYNEARSIVVGTGRVARRTARALRQTYWLGIRNLGFVEDQPSRWTSDLNVLGTTAELPQLISKYDVRYVFIALPMSRYHEARHVFDVLSRTLVEVRLIGDVPNLAGLSLTTSNLDGLPVFGLRESPHFGLNVVIKRVMDVALSLLCLLVLSPLVVLIAVAIKLTSPGPVFYRQERCGLNGRPFQMLKFRSMRVDAERQTGAVWTTKDDPRRTRLGAWLRKLNLDELPQLINVLRGDMSLVGPRPERPVFIQQFSRTVPNYVSRHSVKVGITGWAQVHGWRGNTSLRKRLQYDLYYITHWTPLLDLRILWMTLFRSFFDRNAY